MFFHDEHICFLSTSGQLFFVCIYDMHTSLYLSPDIDECNSSPCQNGGLCLDHENGYTCFCRGGYTGTNCEIGKCSLIEFITYPLLHTCPTK